MQPLREKWFLVGGIAKFLWRVVLAAAVVVAVGTVAVKLIAPPLIERAVTHELRARGLPDASFEVRRVGLRRVAIDDVALDAEGRLTAASLVATYSPLGVLRGEIQTLQIVGAHWVIRVHERRLDLGPMDELFEPRGNGEEGAPLPLRRIEVLASEVIVATPTRQWRVPLQGTLHRTPHGFRVDASATARSLPIEIHADVRRRPRLQVDFSLVARGRGDAALALDGRLATDGRLHVQIDAHDWSMDSVLGGRRVVVDEAFAEGHATFTRRPLAIDVLELDLGAAGIRVDERRLQALHLEASRAEEGIALDVDWASPSSEGELAVRGLPTRLRAASLEKADVSVRADLTAWADRNPLSIVASADASVTRDDEQWSVRIDDGELELESRERGRRLRTEIAFTGAASRERVSLQAEQSSAPGAVQLAGMRAELRRLRLDIDATKVEGRWSARGDVELGLASVVLRKSGLRISRVSVSLPLRYPFSDDIGEGTGHLRVGPVRWRGAKFPAVRGDLVQQGDEVLATLRWPLTPKVTARGIGRIALSTPFSARLRVTAPPFVVEEAPPVLAVLERALAGSIRGKLAATVDLGVEDGDVTQTLDLRLDDVTLSRAEVLHELAGVSGTVFFDSIVPPLVSGGERLVWKSGRIGKLTLSRGHVDLGIEPGPSLVVEEVATDVGEKGEDGRLFVGAFRYGRDQPELHLDIFAESLGLQRWLDLFGRDEVEGTGTLHGHVSATLQLEPHLALRLGHGALLAESGGKVMLKDVRAAEAVLASARTFEDAGELKGLLKQRLLEALRSLEYSSLRFELVRKEGGVTLRVHIAGRGTRGARQEIGGLTINLHHFEEALNHLLRLSGGVKELGHVESTQQP